MELITLSADMLANQLATMNLAMSQPLSLPPFMDMLRNVLGGISRTAFATTIRNIGYVIAVASVLYMAYEVYFRGADPQDVAVGFFKFMLAVLLVTRYHDFFLFILSGVEQIALSIRASDSGFARVFEQLRNLNISIPRLLNALGSALSTFFAFILVVIAQVVSVFAFQIFTILYILYGALLYITGPGFLGLLPSRGGGRYGFVYLTNLACFSLWPIIFTIFDRFLIFAVDSLSAPWLGRNPDINRLMLYWGLMSVLVALLIAFIPVVASSLLRGHGSLGGFMAGLAVSWIPSVGRFVRSRGRRSPVPAPGGGNPGGGSGSPGGSGAGGGSPSSIQNQQAAPPPPSQAPPAASPSASGRSLGAPSYGGSITIPNARP